MAWYIFNLFRRYFGEEQHPRAVLSEDAKYIVFNPKWPDPPRVAFTTLQGAQKIAERLSKKQPKDKFYVMKAVLCVSAVPDVKELSGSDA